MNSSVLVSTFFLTVLLLIGLLFFIRAAVKDRTEQQTFLLQDTQEIMAQKVREYFESRAYKVSPQDSTPHRLTLQGTVRPSWFLAIFLTLLVVCSLSCLSLVVSSISPEFRSFAWLVVGLSPLTGLFYWRNAGRVELVSLEIEANKLTVIAHRDELTQLRQNLDLKTST